MNMKTSSGLRWIVVLAVAFLFCIGTAQNAYAQGFGSYFAYGSWVFGQTVPPAGDEDSDEDGLTNEEEWAGWGPVFINGIPHLFSWDTAAIVTFQTTYTNGIWWAMDSGLAAGPYATRHDSDQDGVSDLLESLAESNPNSADTDSVIYPSMGYNFPDGLPDAFEIYIGMNALDNGNWGVATNALIYIDPFDPLNVITNIVISTNNTDEYMHSDPDGDGLTSWEEYLGPDEMAPVIPPCAEPYVGVEVLISMPGMTPYDDDSDRPYDDYTSPFDFDSDRDLLIDSYEYVGVNQYDPSVDAEVATDDDDADGLSNYREMCVHPLLSRFWAPGQVSRAWRIPITVVPGGNAPFAADACRIEVSGYLNQAQYNRVGDGWPDDIGDVVWGHPVSGPQRWTIPTGVRPIGAGFDTDADLLPDGWELEHGLNPLDEFGFLTEAGNISPSGGLGDPDEDSLLNYEEYFGADGYRCDLITGTGDESNPWITRAVNSRFETDFLIYMHAESANAGTSALHHVRWSDSAHRDVQAPEDYLGITDFYGDGISFTNSFHPTNYPGFFDPEEYDVNGVFTPVPGAPAYVAIHDGNDGTSLDFNPFSVALGDLWFIDIDSDGVYTPSVDGAFYDTDNDQTFTIGTDHELSLGILAGGETAVVPMYRNIPVRWPMHGWDTDDDGIPDNLEIQSDIAAGKSPSSVVHPANPFIPRAAFVTTNGGLPILSADPLEGGTRLFSRDWTVECWAYLRDNDTNEYTGAFVVGEIGVSTINRVAYDIGVTNSRPYATFQTLGGKAYTISAPGMLPKNRWVHIAGVFDHARNGLSLFIDGVLDQSEQDLEESSSWFGASIYGNGGRATLAVDRAGASPAPGHTNFAHNLWLDEVRIWGVPRSVEQISDNRHHIVDPFQAIPTPPYQGIMEGSNNALFAYFTFDDGGKLAHDFSKRAKCSLQGYAFPADAGVQAAPIREYIYLDSAYAIDSEDVDGIDQAFRFDANRVSPVIGFVDGERGAFDSDGDGLPDSWELNHELNPFKLQTPDHNQSPKYDEPWQTAEGPEDDSLRDLETSPDGLDNINEYWARTNPRKNDTDEDAIPDQFEDFDEDGLPNLVEQSINSRPDLADTDDDGIEDSVEQANNTLPLYSLNPALERWVWMDGREGTYLSIPPRSEMRNEDWTVEALIVPSGDHNLADGQGVSLVRRAVQDVNNGLVAAHYELRLVSVGTNLFAEGRYVYVDGNGDGQIMSVMSTNPAHAIPYDNNFADPYPNETNTHVAVTFDNLAGTMRLYRNGQVITNRISALTRPPITGEGPRSYLHLGEGYRGFLGDVRIWSETRLQSDIHEDMHELLQGTANTNLVAYFSLNDGGWPSRNVRVSVDDRLALPPGVAADGDRYIILNPAGGAWVGYEGQIAQYRAATPEEPLAQWNYTVPFDGDRVYDETAGATYEYDSATMMWTAIGSLPIPDAATILSVRYASAPATPIEGDTWYSFGNIFKYESTQTFSVAYGGSVFQEGAMLAGVAADDELAWFISRDEYYRRDTSLAGAPAVAPGWQRWGPAVDWLADARTAVEGVIGGTNQLPVNPLVGDVYLLTNTVELFTYNGYGYTTNAILDEDRFLDWSSGVVWDYDDATSNLVYVADATTDGGGLYIFLKDEGAAWRSDGISSNAWRRWGFIPTTEDFTAPQDWLDQWSHAAVRSGGCLFYEFGEALDAEDISDTDGDGLPDWWEVLYGLDPLDPTGDNGADGDPDGDGLTNLEEYHGGTDPTIPNLFRIAPNPMTVQVGNTVGVSITRPPSQSADALVVNLYSSDTSLFTVEPSTATIAAGETSVEVFVTGVALAEGMGEHNGRITAISGLGQAWGWVYVSNGVSLMMNMGPLTGTNVVAGDTSTMQVRRDRVSDEAAPLTSPLTVFIESTDPALEVPAVVTIPGGDDSVWFPITGVSVQTSIVVQATAVGYPSTAIEVDVTPPTVSPWIAGAQVSNIIVAVGGTVSVDLRRHIGEVASGMTLAMKSDDTSVFSVSPGQAVWAQSDVSSLIQIIGGTLDGSEKLARSTLILTSGSVWTQEVDVIVRPGADFDFDGLLDETEALTGTDPALNDTDNDGISDYDEDSDGDGISNGDEQDVFFTHAGNPDSDDDGFSDGDEVDWRIQCPAGGRHISSPLHSRSPLIQRSMMLDGTGLAISDPATANDDERFDLSSWTIECWFMPTNGVQTGDIFSRFTQYGQTNYVLRLSNGVPVVEFTTDAGTVYGVSADAAIPTNAWTHLAATWDPTMDSLSLFVDLVEYQSQLCLEECATGGGTTTIGEGVQGQIDELRIWNVGRQPAELAARWLWFGPSSLAAEGGGLVAWYPFDDSENVVVTNAYTGTVISYGAEDYRYPLDWDYALSGVIFSTNAAPLYGIIDEDADDLPDWWESMFFGGDADPDADTDYDGLLNSVEYLLDTNPRDDDTDADGVGDALEDIDNDGLSNGDEIAFGTDPTDPDTDDDEHLDGDEIDPSVMSHNISVSSPTESRSPMVSRSLVLDGGAMVLGRSSVPGEEERFSLTPWTLECWMMPTNGLQTGSLIERITSANQTNFALRLVNNQPAVEFTSDNGRLYRASSSTAIPMDEWSHLAGTWNPSTYTLTLYVDGVPVQSQLSLEDCATGAGTQSIGAGVQGLMDELRIWKTARSDEEIFTGRDSIVGHPDMEASLLANFRFDDGGTSAEDFTHRLNWEYAISGVTFASNLYADVSGIDDADSDGMPTWWEDLFFLSDAFAVEDIDGDGLDNLSEYLCGTHPAEPDTDDNGILDGSEDFDGDGLANGDESLYGTDVQDSDTDDDGCSDGDEISSLVACEGRITTSPSYSRSPLMRRSMIMDGVAYDVPGRTTTNPEDRFDLSDWTLECYVMLTNLSQTGSVIARETDSGRTNFALRIVNNVPVAEFTTAAGTRYGVSSGVPLAIGDWHHIAAVFDDEGSSLALYVDGLGYGAQIAAEPCARGQGTLTFGDGLFGYLDDVTIYAEAKTIDQLELNQEEFGRFLRENRQPVVSYHGVDFFDGTNSFADSLAAEPTETHGYVPGLDSPDGNNFSDPLAALGLPIDDWNASSPTGFVSLGISDITTNYFFGGQTGELIFEISRDELLFNVGSLKLAFDDGALLQGSGDARPDLYVFEVGSAKEDTHVFISQDGDQWEYVGVATGGTAGVNIDVANRPLMNIYPGFAYQYGFRSVVGRDFIESNTNEYRYVWLVDAGVQGDRDGLSSLGMPGADIDAVGIRRYPKSTVLAWYPFDDGGNSAEDYMHQLDWDFAIAGVSFTNSTYITPPGYLDMDGDQIPDWWEELFSNGDVVSGGDIDEDGLDNKYEYFCQTNPNEPDSDGDGITDADEDFDNDGLSNGGEDKRRSDPRLPDTDDDGILDSAEVLSSPNNSLSPLVDCVLELDGNAGSFVSIPSDARLALSNWTAEAWVRPSALPAGDATIIRREVSANATNYYLGINGLGQVVAEFTPGDRSSNVRLVYTNAISTSVWTHVLASFNGADGILSIAIDGKKVSDMHTAKHPVMSGVGPVATVVGAGFEGQVDEIRIWSEHPTNRSLSTLATVLHGYEEGLVSYLRFDDRTSTNTSGVATWTSGQVEDFVYRRDWEQDWRNAADLQGGALMVTNIYDCPVHASSEDDDGDGMPNGWEVLNGLSMNSAGGKDGPSGDPDGDGLINLYEYYSGSHAQSVDTDGDGTADGLEDPDGDGVSCREEQEHLSRPDMADTDDDGLTDWAELNDSLDLRNSLDPYVMKYIRNETGAGIIEVDGIIPGKDDTGERFNLDTWTIEGAVRFSELPSVAGNDAVLLRRRAGVDGYSTFELGVDSNDYPYVMFHTDIGDAHISRSSYRVVTNEWLMLTGRLGEGEQAGHRQLDLFYQNEWTAVQLSDARPVLGRQNGPMVFGENVVGDIDEFRIWSIARHNDEIDRLQDRTLLYGEDVATLGVLSVTNGYVQRNMQSDLKLGEWTIEAWFKTGQEGTIVQREAGTADDGEDIFNYRLRVDGDGKVTAEFAFKALVEFWQGGAGWIANQHLARWGVVTLVSRMAVDDGNWHFVSFSFDGLDAQLALDGIMQDVITIDTENDLPSLGEVAWHMMAADGVEMPHSYVHLGVDNIEDGATIYLNPWYYLWGGQTYSPAIQDGLFTIGDNFRGTIDEVRIFDRGLSMTEIEAHRFKKVSPNAPDLASYFDMDDIGDLDPATIVDKANPDAFGFLLEGMTVKSAANINAPIEYSAINILGLKLAGYWPMDDGQHDTRLAGQVEDFTRRLDFDFGGTFSSTNDIHFVASTASETAWITDSDHDGMPDWFEVQYSLNPNAMLSIDHPEVMSNGDLDGDGLSNLYEYQSGTDPRSPDTDNDGISDDLEDGDGDGLSNVGEQNFGSDARLPDTDDDGIGDAAESINGSNPGLSISPLFDRVLMLDGTTNSYISMPHDERFELDEWVIEAWVNPTGLTAQAEIIACEESPGVYSYMLGLNGLGQPELRFSPTDGLADVVLTYTNALYLNDWRHLRGSFDPMTGKMGLAVDDKFVIEMYTAKRPMVGHIGFSETRVGAGFQGYLDEVMIWSEYPVTHTNRDLTQIHFGSETGLVSYLRFDDGSSYEAGVTGTSLMPSWDEGQVEDYTQPSDWSTDWRNAGTIIGTCVVIDAPVGTPVNPTRLDFDDDGIPNGWEAYYNHNPYSPSGDDGAEADLDGDGLQNLYEYLAGTHPGLVDSDGDGITDDLEDEDGDGLSNIDEQSNQTDPGSIDTDDDGMTDLQEINEARDPLSSIDPYIMRYVRNETGNGYLTVDGVVPGEDSAGERFNLDEWTVECMVRLNQLPSETGNNVVLVRRTARPGAQDFATFELGIAVDNRPYVLFESDIGVVCRVDGSANSPLTTNEWVSLTARLGMEEGTTERALDLQFDNKRFWQDVTDATPALGRQYEPLVMASNLVGDIDEVRVWNTVRPYEELQRLQNRSLLFGQDVATLGVLKLDGANWMTRGDRDDVALDKWTIEAWFRTEAPGVIIQREAGAGGDGRPIYNYRVEVDENNHARANFAFKSRVDVSDWLGDGWGWDFDNGEYRWGSLILEGDINVADGEWHFVSFAFDGEDAKLRIDGIAQDAVTVDPENDLPAIGDVDWHMTVTDPYSTPAGYMVSNVNDNANSGWGGGFYGWGWGGGWGGNSSWNNDDGLPYYPATQAGIVTVGKQFVGEIDELRIFDAAMGSAMVESHRMRKLPPNTQDLISYFDFDNVVKLDSLYVEDKSAPGVTAILLEDAHVVTGSNSNSPVDILMIDVLAPRLAGYWPMDDGMHASRTSGQVEDYLHRLDFGYAATFSDTNDIHFTYMDEIYLTNYVNLATEWTDETPLRIDSDLDGMPDWFEQQYGLDANRADTEGYPLFAADADLDGDGLTNLDEYRSHTDPRTVDTDRDGVDDADDDTDGDGISNFDEIYTHRTDPALVDTDDDGYADGTEIAGWLPNPTDNYGIGSQRSSPLYSLSPRVHRSLDLAGSSLQVPYSDRFRFEEANMEIADLVRPNIAIVSPSNGVISLVRFVDLQGSVESEAPVVSAMLYINNRYVRNISLENNEFDETIIIGAGNNDIRIVAVDEDGIAGETEVAVRGEFAAAAIRVTQTWDIPGDLDTWLVDPMGRHMGWTIGGPTLPASIQDQIPGSMLDIDDIMGTGPENITLESGNAIGGTYQVWVNNYSSDDNPMSTIRLLVGEGTAQERLVEYGPHEMPVSDGNASRAAAWWHVASVTWPGEPPDDGGTNTVPGDTSGDDSGGSSSGIVIDPAGRLISEYDPGQERELVDLETGLASVAGWTIEGWVKPLDDSQTGAIAAFYDHVGYMQYVVGLSSNRPFMRVRSAGGTWYEVDTGALRANEWSHVAFVYSREHNALRIHVDGMIMSSREMIEEAMNREGRLFIDDSFVDPISGSTNSFTAAYLDELRIWSLARHGGLIAAKKHDLVGKSQSLVASYHFDDGGQGIEDSTEPLDRSYDLGYKVMQGLGSLPDVLVNDAPGPDGRWGTADDLGGAIGADGHNDHVSALDAGPVYGDVDADLDGLPNWWEILFYGVGTDAEAGDDPDGDSLTNLDEFRVRTNPFDKDSDGDSVLDSGEDFDGDGLANGVEADNESNPTLPDTDDDGLDDASEIVLGSQPNNAVSPWSNKVLRVSDSTSYVRLPKNMRYQLKSWTVSAWVNPTTISNYVTILSYSYADGVENYHIGLDTNQQAVVSFTSEDYTTNVVLRSTNSVPLDDWTHIEATFDPDDNSLSLTFNDALDSTMNTPYRCAVNGLGPVLGVIGLGLDGYIEDVKIETPDTGSGSDRTIAQFAFDDGTHSDGVSGMYNWNEGHLQNFASGTGRDWENHWLEAATLVGNNISVTTATLGSPDIDPPVPPGFDLIPTDTDGDGMVDDWELRYPYDLMPFVDDSREDGDGDGWDNLSEYMWSFQNGCVITNSSNPTDGNSYPTPGIEFVFKYDGVNGEGALHMEVFGSDTRDGLADALVNITPALPIDWTQPYITTIATWDEGHVRQGETWLFAFIDVSGDGVWNPGEPAGTEVMNEGFEIGWGDVPTVTVGLTDSFRGYPRFTWTQEPETNGTRVVVRDLGSAGAPIIVDTYLQGDRNYFHEGDYRAVGIAHLEESTYQWFAGADSGTFNVEWGTPTAPTLIAPVGNEHLLVARNELKWSMFPGVAQVRIVITSGYADGPKNYAGWHLAPYRESDGTYHMDLPTYAGDLALTNGQYFWQVTAWNPKSSISSAWQPFTVDLKTSDLGPYSISGTISQEDIPVTNGWLVVQAYKELGFSGEPEAEIHVQPSASADTTFQIRGLRGGTNVYYYVRAFLDQNDNDRLDYFESFGYVVQNDQEAVDWCDYRTPRRILLNEVVSGEEIDLAHRDTDHDGIWDAWEYQYFSSLAVAGSGVDSDGDGLDDDLEYDAGSSPVDTDSDDDGLSDWIEVRYHRSSPVSVDSDGDALSDWFEVNTSETLLYTADSDEDSLDDYYEWYTAGFDPMNPDDDSDGLLTSYEVLWDGTNGFTLGQDISPVSSDTDGDTFTDFYEVNTAGFDPMNPDDDSDGVLTSFEVAWDGTNGYTAGSDMDPLSDDTDSDTLTDFYEVNNVGLDPLNPDDDSDGLLTSFEVMWDGTNGYTAGQDINPASSDTDGDTLSDPYEVVTAGYDPLNPDDDSDGIPTAEELMWDGTNGYTAGSDLDPLSNDTDGDSVPDLMEIAAGSSPFVNTETNWIVMPPITVNTAGDPVVSWNIYRNDWSTDVRFYVERSFDNILWTRVDDVLSEGDVDMGTNVIDTTTTRNFGNYRLVLEFEP